jgi:hypothetical protein
MSIVRSLNWRLVQGSCPSEKKNVNKWREDDVDNISSFIIVGRNAAYSLDI